MGPCFAPERLLRLARVAATQRLGAGDRLDAGHGAPGGAVQEGMPGGIGTGGTVHGKSHPLHGSVDTLRDRSYRRRVGGVVRPQVYGLHRERGMASFGARQWRRDVAARAVIY